MYNPIFHVVLYEPEIPQNTGNIGRLCVATRSHLHLVGRLGFSLSEKERRRAGLDYWERLLHSRHDTFDPIAAVVPRERMYFFSKRAEASLYDIEFKPGDHLVFGGETDGLPLDMREEYADRLCRIPMLGDVRSLNLANAVAVVVFEGLRQMGRLEGGNAQ